MLRVMQYAALAGAIAFALAFVGLSAWRSYQQQHQANDYASTEEAQRQANARATGGGGDEAIARYNYWLMIFTGVLAFVALFQIGFLISADTTAGRAADAAREAVQISDRTAQQQLRAYVSGFPSFISSFDEQHTVKASVKLINRGQTPAYNLIHRTMVVVAPYPLPDGYKFPDITGQEGPPLVLQPNEPFIGFKFADRVFTKEEIAGIKSGSLRVYIYGMIRYETIFTKRAWSTFNASASADAANLEKLTSNYLLTDLVVTYDVSKTGNDADRP